MMYSHQPRTLTDREVTALRKTVRVVYPDDMTPCDPKTLEPLK